MKPEPVVVESRLDPDGRSIPMAFNYRQQRIEINSYGRRWRTKHAEHVLVMDQRRRVYELAYRPETGSWLLTHIPSPLNPGRAAA